MDLRTITELALTLPTADRARLARELLESLESLPSSEVESLWLEEAARRADQIDSGAVALIPADEVSRKARTLLK
jgi:hypothetical protein